MHEVWTKLGFLIILDTGISRFSLRSLQALRETRLLRLFHSHAHSLRSFETLRSQRGIFICHQNGRDHHSDDTPTSCEAGVNLLTTLTRAWSVDKIELSHNFGHWHIPFFSAFSAGSARDKAFKAFFLSPTLFVRSRRWDRREGYLFVIRMGGIIILMTLQPLARWE